MQFFNHLTTQPSPLQALPKDHKLLKKLFEKSQWKHHIFDEAETEPSFLESYPP